jgi:hypothetical protein
MIPSSPFTWLRDGKEQQCVVRVLAPNSGKAHWVADNVRRLCLGRRLVRAGLESRYGNHPKNPFHFSILYFVPRLEEYLRNFKRLIENSEHAV